jgi:hypothetical protein
MRDAAAERLQCRHADVKLENFLGSSLLWIPIYAFIYFATITVTVLSDSMFSQRDLFVIFSIAKDLIHREQKQALPDC